MTSNNEQPSNAIVAQLREDLTHFTNTILQRIEANAYLTEETGFIALKEFLLKLANLTIRVLNSELISVQPEEISNSTSISELKSKLRRLIVETEQFLSLELNEDNPNVSILYAVQVWLEKVFISFEQVNQIGQQLSFPIQTQTLDFATNQSLSQQFSLYFLLINLFRQLVSACIPPIRC